jgi:hypothetical protein
MKNLKFTRVSETEKKKRLPGRLPEPQRLHVQNPEDEMEDLYREKENSPAMESPS